MAVWKTVLLVVNVKKFKLFWLILRLTLALFESFSFFLKLKNVDYEGSMVNNSKSYEHQESKFVDGKQMVV